MALKDTENTNEKTAQGIMNPMVLSMQVTIPNDIFEKVLREILLKRLYTIPEAALYLGKGTDAIREMVYSRTIPIIQRGDKGKIYLDRSDLDAWIEAEKRFAGEV